MHPEYYVFLKEMPVLPNGKRNYKKLPIPVMEEEALIEPETELEKSLAGIIVELLKIEQVRVTSNLIALGMTSLTAMRLSATIKQKLGIYIPTKDILSNPTIREMVAEFSESAVTEEDITVWEKRKYYPISENQRGVYIDWEMNRNALQYNIPIVQKMDGMDALQLKNALVSTIAAHPYLKTRLDMREGDVVQLRLDTEPIVVDLIELSEEPDAVFFQSRVRPFDLFKDRLYRVELYQTPTSLYLFRDVHHLIFDGASNFYFIQEVMKAYDGEVLQEETYTSFDYALTEKEKFESEEFVEAENFFDNLTADVETTVYPRSTNPAKVSGSSEQICTIDRKNIHAFCKRNGITENIYFLTVLMQVLHRLTREENVLITTISNGRSENHLLGLMGMFVKTLPLVSKQEKITFDLAAKAMQQQFFAVQARDFYPFTRLHERNGVRPEIMFSYVEGYNNLFMDGLSLPKEENASLIQLDTVKTPMFVTVTSVSESEYTINTEFDSALYSPEDMQLFNRCYKVMAEKAAVSDGVVTSISLLTDDEQESIISLSAGKDLDVDLSRTFINLFTERAHLSPDAVAVVDVDSQYSYAELDHKSNCLAHQLIAAGVKADDFVCVMMERRKEFILCVHAIHKVGAAYTPLDIEYPIDRLQYMIENSESKVLLTSHEVLDEKRKEPGFALDEENTHIVYVEELEYSEEIEAIDISSPDRLAYMIYTSGSTGNPKGTMLHQAGLKNFIDVVIDMEDLTSDDRIESHRSFSFDAHIEDIYAVLTLGGSVHIMPSAIRKDLEAIYQFIVDHKITGGGYATAIGALLMNSYPDLPVRFITMGGEKLEGVYSDTVRIINVYGPTECTDDTSYFVVEPGERVVNIPIGKTVANNWSFIVDAHGNLVPQGVAGELCFAGIQVGRGYWQLPEKTTEVFVDCPFVKEDRWGNAVRMYHTGDLARWNETGDLEYISRIDTQVKLRGFRIELGEIESRAMQFEGMMSVAAEVKEVNGIQHLCLYYTSEDVIDESLLNDSLAQSLAEYMVPNAYIRMEIMPLTPNGKVNRKALPVPVIRSAAEYVEPSTLTERKVAELMKEVLGLKQPVGALDSFFALGGDSIKSIRLISKLRAEGMSIQVAEVMKLKTVKAIADAIKIGGAVEIDQSAWSGNVPQTAITSFFFDLNLPKKDHYNQTMFIRSKERVEVDAIKQSIAALVEHHDMLRAVVQDGIYVRGIDEPNLFGWEELDYVHDENYQKEIEKACELRQASIDLNNGPLFKATLFHTPEYDAILMVCHHLVVDGVSWRILLEDFNNVYALASSGKAIVLPSKTHSFKEYAEKVQQYADSFELKREILYWDEVYNKMQNLSCSATKDSQRKFAAIDVILDAQTTHRILTDAGAPYNADINDILMTALGRSYYKMTGESAVSVLFEGHGREYVGDSDLQIDRTVGWFTSLYPVVLEQLDGDLRSCLRTSKETLHRVPNKGVGYNILRFLQPNTQYSTDQSELIVFNYLGEMDEQTTEDAKFVAVADISSGHDSAVENVFGSDLSINSCVVDGVLKSNLSYNTALFSEEQALQFMDGMMNELQAIVEHTSTMNDIEVTASDFGESEWSDAEFQQIYTRFESMNTPIRRIYPLSPMQEGMILKYIVEPDSLAYRLVSRISLDVLPSEEHLRYALDALAAKHEVLRTSIIYQNVEQYRQAIVERPLGLVMKDITDTDDKELAMMNMYKAEQQRGFDLENQSLFRIVCAKTSEQTCQILLSVHHIIVDGWCISLYMNDMLTYLAEAMANQMKPIVAQNEGRYERYIREILNKDADKGLAYWNKLLDGYTTKAVIPSTGLIPENERTLDNTCHLDITGEDLLRLNVLMSSEQITMNTIIEMAWAIVLQVYNRQDDVVFVKVVSGRNNSSEGVEDVVGLFINSVPVRVTLKKGATIRQSLQELQQQAAETNEWDFCPLSAIQQQTELGGELFQSIVAFENYDSGNTDQVAEKPFNLELLYSKEESINDITVTAYTEADNLLRVNLEFDNTLYRKEEIERVASVMKHIFEIIGQHPDADICPISRLSKKDTLELVKLGKGESLSYDSTQTLVDLFVNQARQTPDSICVVYKDKQYTYREVDEMTNNLAIRLQEDYGVQPEMVVGVMIDRSELMLIYPMAIMKAGGAYMPLDFHFPSERLEFMCKDAEVGLILSEGNRVAEAMPGYTGRVVNSEILDTLHATNGGLNPMLKAKPENMFIILYTSGSTGVPKGVMLEHRNIVNFCHWYIQEFDVTAEDKAVAYANFGFDAHMMDLYPVTSVGGSVYIIPSDMRLDLMAMNNYMEQEQLNIAFMTTQVGYMFATTIENQSLRLLSVGGEKLQPLAKPNFRLYNGYGPTECTLYSTFYNIDRDYDSSYIGRPLAGYQLFIVDQNMNMVPRGAAGELVVAGVGVGRGYLKRPELNEEKFITYMGQQAYRTGDLVRWSHDGNIDFIGRTDNQVKIRGLRIELGEIEEKVSKCPGISAAAVAVKEISGAQHICCYYIAEAYLDGEYLMGYLQDKLTEYMIPTAYMQLDTFPLTPNGKVNRNALPLPEMMIQSENVAPETEKERVLFDIACELLKTNQFGVTDDLTRIGLTSLLGIKLVMMASKKGLIIKLADLIKKKSIRATLQYNMAMVAWANTYTPEKPVVVVVCGATPYKDMAPYVERLTKQFSVLVYEPLEEHYDYIFQDADINEVVEMYSTLLDFTLEPGATISAFTGHCFGGEIAYRMAVKWEETTGMKVPMVMLDVFWRLDALTFDEEYIIGLIPQHLKDKYGNEIRSYAKAMHMYDHLGREGEPSLYNGDVVLFRATLDEPLKPQLIDIYAEVPSFKEAMKNITQERELDNASFWQGYYPSMKVYNVDGHHMSMLEKQHVSTYADWIENYLNNNKE